MIPPQGSLVVAWTRHLELLLPSHCKERDHLILSMSWSATSSWKHVAGCQSSTSWCYQPDGCPITTGAMERVVCFGFTFLRGVVLAKELLQNVSMDLGKLDNININVKRACFRFKSRALVLEATIERLEAHCISSALPRPPIISSCKQTYCND